MTTSGWVVHRREAQAARMRALNGDPTFAARKALGRRKTPPPPRAIPAHAHPLVRILVREMNEQLASLNDVASRSGVGRDTIRFWDRHMPRLDTFEAALNVLGLELCIRRRDDGRIVS